MAHRVFHAWDGSNGEIGRHVDALAPCPISGSRQAVVLHNRDRYGYPLRTVISKASGLVYVDPRPDDDAIDDFYRNSYRRYYKSAAVPKWKHTARNARIAGQRITMVQSLAPKGAAVLDVGTGSGELLYVGNRHGYKMQGIEVDHAYSQFGRQSYGVKIINQSLLHASLPDNHFDVVTCFHVLEHLADPAAALRKIAATLKPGGYLLLEVPNVESLDARFSQKWHPGHLFHFNCPTIAALANVCGLETQTVHTCDRRSIVGATIKKTSTPPEIDWQTRVDGNFEQTWQLLMSQSQQGWLSGWQVRLKRVQDKVHRNFREWAAAITQPNRRQLVDKVAERRYE
ncbi:methyltransferase domain-containing protein [bacterium]|nr:methyltransferase domain-containing protein [bacterium]